MNPPALMPADLPVPMAAGFSPMILLVVVVLGFFLLVQRPMRKQQAAQRALQNQVAEGSRVMLTSGMFGTVTHLGDKQAIVELAPGLEVTVLRQAISKAVTAADEEFEFSDETLDQPGDTLDQPGATAMDAVGVPQPAAPAPATHEPVTHDPVTHEPAVHDLTIDPAAGIERPAPGVDNR